MRRSTILVLSIVIALVVCLVPFVLFATVRVEESSSSSVEFVVDDSTASAQMTIGVILASDAADYGWRDLVTNALTGTREATLNQHRVIVVDNLGTDGIPAEQLAEIVASMHRSGATMIFTASDLPAEAELAAITAQYPDIAFVSNVAQRDEIAWLLNVPPFTAYTTAPHANDHSEDEDGSGVRTVAVNVAILAVLLGIGLWFALRISNASHAARRDDIEAEQPPKRKRRRSGSAYYQRRVELEDAARAQMTGFDTPDAADPLLHDLSTYILGDQQFDDSFALERASGDFLGDCGLQISAYVNRYDPDKVTALRLWLFDAHDLQTASALLASDHAHESAALRDTLSQTSALHRAAPGAEITLETATLRLHARVLDMRYGFADTLPLDSFFEHLVLEIAVYEKSDAQPGL